MSTTKITFSNVTTKGGVRSGILSLTATTNHGDTIEMTSFRGPEGWGEIEFYTIEEDGLPKFRGYLPYFERTTNVWGEPFPREYRQLWVKTFARKKTAPHLA